MKKKHVYRVEYVEELYGELFVAANTKKEAINKAEKHLADSNPEACIQDTEMADGDKANI